MRLHNLQSGYSLQFVLPHHSYHLRSSHLLGYGTVGSTICSAAEPRNFTRLSSAMILGHGCPNYGISVICYCHLLRENMTKEARRKEKARIAAIYEKYVEEKMHQYIIERMGIKTRYSDLDMGGLVRPRLRQEKQSETEHEVEGMNLKEFMTTGNGKGSSGQPIKKKPKVSVLDSDKPKRKLKSAY